MWKSLFMDMYESLADGCKDMNEAIVLAVHIFNVAKGMQCTGLQEDDPACGDILPEGWNSNPQLYSFRYSSKSLTIYEKLLRVNPVKINIHAVRSDQNDKIFHFSVDLNEIASDYEGPEFTESLIEKVLIPYEQEIISNFVTGPALTSKKEPVTEKNQIKKHKSILEDDEIPFGIPYVRRDFQSSNPYSNPFGVPGNLIGPGHPIFAGNPVNRKGPRWDPPGPLFAPNPDHFPSPPGYHGFYPPPGYF